MTPGADQDPAQVLDAAPTVNYSIHSYVGPDSSGMARVEGHGAGGGGGM